MLSFSKKERIAIFIIVAAIIIIAILPFVYHKSNGPQNLPLDTGWMAAANALQEKTNNADYTNTKENDNNPASYQYDRVENDYTTERKGTLFQFDPNTLGAEGFKKLGLRDKTINTLMNYRNKGGQFRKPEDLAKIYGLRPDEFERLKPFVSIAGNNNGSTYYKETNYQKTYEPAKPADASLPTPKYKLKTIEINSADAAAYESLYGIGAKLAARIINFRDKLGGFYQIEQVGETFGVPDSTFQKIKPQLQVNAAAIKKININTAAYDELNNHPYINSKTAYQILKYRKEKGSFTNIEEVKALVQPNDSYEKMIPYIAVK